MIENINRDLVPIKAHYFLYNAATGCIVPFLPTLAKQLGFSGILVGTVYTILPISGLIAKPLFGSLADKYKLHKSFFLFFQAFLTISFFTMHFIPEVVTSADTRLKCDNSEAFLELCPEKLFSQDVLNNVISSNKSEGDCQISCQSLSIINDTVCTHWHLCNPDGIPFNFTAHYDIYHNLPLKHCVNVKVEKAIFSDGQSTRRLCESRVSTPCRISCSKHPPMDNLIRQTKNSTSFSQTSTYQFNLFLWASITSWIGMAVVVSLGDAICFNLLGEDKRKEYGKQKMWGSIGFGIFGISAGYLVDVFSRDETNKDYTCIFYIMLVAMIFDMIVSATLTKRSLDPGESEPSVLWELWSLMREGRILVFAFWCIGSGMCTGVVWNFLLWYTEELVPADAIWLKTLQGLVIGVENFLGELPFNFISGTVLRKLGHINVMSLVLLVYAIRFMAYSITTNAWWIILLEVLHGPSTGLCWPAMVSYGDKVAPSGTKATIQGVVGAIFEGVGVSAGSLLCGYLMDEYKGAVTFRIFSGGALIWLTIYWILQLLLRKAKAYPLQQGHSHLASYAPPNDAILMTMSQELQTY
ncbi:major facilitator superfamily domain-containing protein 6 isoform X1 [Leptopilina heterotoma]|uniref:major facilitator superfamily domain-containing protein 6 isoform X1 n=1 Tax=Leptopilina heterotoma TaxID=63436 RepID=UPI001CA9B34D|nr:major facilitator superfamily domain-containing protein 6 isoform X1 [Leptopilina heterotoma]